MPTFAPAELIPFTEVGNTATTLFTAGASTAIFRKASVLNRTASSVTITLYKVPSGGSPDTSNVFINLRTLAAGESWIINEVNGMVFTLGETLQGVASSASALNLGASGVLYTP